MTQHPSLLTLISVPKLYKMPPKLQQGPRSVSQCFPVEVQSSGDARFPFSCTSARLCPYGYHCSHTPSLSSLLNSSALSSPAVSVSLVETKTHSLFTGGKDKRGSTGTTLCKFSIAFTVFATQLEQRHLYLFHGLVINFMMSLAFYNFFPHKEVRLALT